MTKQETARKINEIRKTLKYATKDQGVASEERTINDLLKGLKKEEVGKWVETGGFRYTRTKGGIMIHPKFSFAIRYK